MFKNFVSAVKDALPDEVKDAAKKKVNQWKGITPDEAIVREATNGEKWGPHGEQLKTIARMTREGKWSIVWEVLEERMRCDFEGEKWRRAYKALSVIEFLVANGDERIPGVVARSGHLERLMRFEYRDARGKDEGVNVRHRAEKIKALVEDPRSIEEARERAERNRGKYSGMSSAEARRMGSGSSYSDSRDSGARAFGGGSGSSSVVDANVSSLSRPSVATTTTTTTTTKSATTTGGGASQWDHVRVPPSGGGGGASAAAARVGATMGFDATKDGESSDDEDASVSASSSNAPKIIFREAPIPRAPNALSTISPFAPPPKSSNSAVAAVNYSTSSGGASASRAAPSASSIDDLLGGLSVGAPPPAAAAAAAPAASAQGSSSQWSDLDGLFGAAPPHAAQARSTPNPYPSAAPTDPFAASFGVPPSAPQPIQTANYAHSSAAPAPADPFGLSSFGTAPAPSAVPAGSPTGIGGSPRKSRASEPMDALAALTADMGLGGGGGSGSNNIGSSSSTPMAPFSGGGSLI
jgi:epsin